MKKPYWQPQLTMSVAISSVAMAGEFLSQGENEFDFSNFGADD